MRLEYRPLVNFPGVPTPDYARKSSPFATSTKWGNTVDMLDRELRALKAEDIVLELDVTEDQIRLDGSLRAQARTKSPAVALSFQSKHGPLRYSCDKFTKWEHNVRAIAVGLENLRRLDRYGIASRGEQYTGYKALPSATAIGPVVTEAEAKETLYRLGGFGPKHSIRSDPPMIASVYKEALRRTHPDAGGDAADFDKVRKAGEVLGL
jgi:hypothetical protein